MNREESFLSSEYINEIKSVKYYLNTEFTFPLVNEEVKLGALDGNKNKYIIDINRKRAILSRCTYQTRIETTIQLLRLDIDNKPHVNHDYNETISGNHIHIYTDEYGDGIALELNDPLLNIINPDFDLNRFNIDKNKEDILYDYFEAFSDFCNLKNIPLYQQCLS